MAEGVRKVSELIIKEGRTLIVTDDTLNVSDLPNGTIYVSPDTGEIKTKLRNRHEWTKLNPNELFDARTIQTDLLTNSSITSNKIVSNAILTEHIKDSSVTTAKIKNYAIVKDKLANNAVTQDKILNKSIVWSKVADGAIDSTKIATYGILTKNIADDAINQHKILNDSITTSKVKDKAITTSKIGVEQVTGSRIADEAVTTSKIAIHNITFDLLDANTQEKINLSSAFSGNLITGDQIANSTISNNNIKDLNVTTEKINNLAITKAKIANLTISNDKIANKTITTSKIADRAITNSLIDDAAITNSKLGFKSISESKIATSAITLDKIASNSINASKIANKAVTNEKIADSTITLAKLSTEVRTEMGGLKIVNGTAQVDGNLHVAGAIVAEGTVNASRIYNYKYGDIAEGYKPVGTMQAGDILEALSSDMTCRASTGSRKVIGVYSDCYAQVLNASDKEIATGFKVPVGLLGKVPVYVLGRATIGDLIVSAGGGVGTVNNNPKPGTVVGKVLENKSDPSTARVMCLISLA